MEATIPFKKIWWKPKFLLKNFGEEHNSRLKSFEGNHHFFEKVLVEGIVSFQKFWSNIDDDKVEQVFGPITNVCTKNRRS